jgi:chemotaxis protein CheD
MHVSAARDAAIVTYALGSCLGITVYDPVAKVGGMLHVMLPDSSLDIDRARERPYMFVDTGVPLLFRGAYAAGARKERIIVKVAGGAAIHESNDRFQIGKRNMIKLRELLWRNGVLIKAADVGGTVSRTMRLDVDSGAVLLKINGAEANL